MALAVTELPSSSATPRVSEAGDAGVRSIADRVTEAVEEKGVKALGIEGADEAEWVLVDLGDVVLHVMQRKVRDLYQLEKLWAIKPTRTRKKAE